LIPKTEGSSESVSETEHSTTETSIHVFSNPVFQPNEDLADNKSVQGFTGLHPSIQMMFAELNHLSAMMANMSNLSSAEDGPNSFKKKLDVAEQRMFRIIHCEPGDLNSSRETLFRLRAYPMAGTIFLYLYLRSIPPSSTALDYFMMNLRDALTDGNVVDDTRTFPPDVLFWVLFMGGIASGGGMQRQWFRTQATKIRVALALDSWAVGRQILMRFPFTGSDCESHCQEFWAELT
jgi:hypothetical protein